MPDQQHNWQRLDLMMDSPTSSPEEQLQQGRLSTARMQIQHGAPALYLPEFAANHAASTASAPAFHRGRNASHGLPYRSMVNMNVNNHNHHNHLLHQQRALSQATLAPPMRRNVSNRSEPSMPAQGRRAMALAPDRRGISYEGHAVTPLPRVSESPLTLDFPDVGMNPATYLSSIGTNLSPQDIFLPDTFSAPPSMISASSVAEAPYPMTRENSHVHASPGADMQRLTSFTSHAAESPFDHGASDFSQQDGSWKTSDVDSDLFGLGNGFLFPPLHQYASFENQTPVSPSSVMMERENSATSMKSTRSTASHVERRAKEARERVIQTSKATTIAPMPQMLPQNKATPLIVHEGHVFQESNKNKPRPKSPKQCSFCNECPDGFRGDHELRRHISAKHGRVVKKYICRDPTLLGIETGLKVIYPLSRCKACASGKQYGAYYNAAAHLRRTHFRTKPSRGRAGASMNEKRGGKGGGNWPSMPELKPWFQEILVGGDGFDSLDMGHDSPDERSPSLDGEEALHASNTHMDNVSDQLQYGDIDLYGLDFASPNSMPASYVVQSIQAVAGLGLMPEQLIDNDIDMSSSSQDSVFSSTVQNMDHISLDQAMQYMSSELF
ncbi:hypothetical protein ACHAQJ_002494 [Trichoderma viride]